MPTASYISSGHCVNSGISGMSAYTLRNSRGGNGGRCDRLIMFEHALYFVAAHTFQ